MSFKCTLNNPTLFQGGFDITSKVTKGHIPCPTVPSSPPPIPFAGLGSGREKVHVRVQLKGDKVQVTGHLKTPARLQIKLSNSDCTIH